VASAQAAGSMQPANPFNFRTGAVHAQDRLRQPFAQSVKIAHRVRFVSDA
jgi:hypothetical protein